MFKDGKTIRRFKGLNNVGDPLELGHAWLTQADNVLVDRAGRLRRRDGFGQAVLSGAMSGAYCTQDQQRFYIVRDGVLEQVHEDLTSTELRSGLTAAAMHWAEVNGLVLYSNGPDKGLIYPDGTVRNWGWPMPPQPDAIAIGGALSPGIYRVKFTFKLPDGRETGAGDAAELQIEEGQAIQVRNVPQEPGCQTCIYIASADSEVFALAVETTLSAFVWNAGPDQLGRELVAAFAFPPPAGAVQPAVWRGRAWLMEWIPAIQQTVIWESEPMGLHLFNLEAKGVPVPGVGLLLAAHADGLVIGTDRAIHVWNGEALAQVADYGVVPGWASCVDDTADGRPLYLWTQRGVCRALPFENLTQRRISVAPGVQVGAVLIHQGGNSAFLATLQAGGTAHNPRS